MTVEGTPDRPFGRFSDDELRDEIAFSEEVVDRTHDLKRRKLEMKRLIELRAERDQRDYLKELPF
jgi:hypothetical protein